MLNPTAVPWGGKAFPKLLGSLEAGKEYDSTLIAAEYTGEKVSHACYCFEVSKDQKLI